MRKRKITRFISVVAAIGLIATIVMPTLAAPVPTGTASLRAAVAGTIMPVRWRGHGWHDHGNGGAVAAGVIGGMLLGGIIASQANRGYYGGPVYYGPPSGYYGPPGYYGSPDWLAYCSSRYRSFDPASGTYMGYDGRRHYCR